MTPRRKAGSRRDRHDLRPLGLSRGAGVGPENRPRGYYVLEFVFKCRDDKTEMGRTRRFTDPSMEGHTKTTLVPGTSWTPWQAGEYEKWRFRCVACGKDVPMRPDRIEDGMNAITRPWARGKKIILL